MKVAIMFSGFLRFYKQTHPAWKRLIDKYNADVFIHTWNNESYKKPSAVLDFNDSGQVDSEPLNVDEVIELYKPKSIVTENYENMHDHFKNLVEWQEHYRQNVYLKQHPENTWILYNQPIPAASMFYKRWRVSQLKQKFELENSFIYDVVLLSRTDFLINDIFELSNGNSVVSGPWPDGGTQPWVNYDRGVNDFWVYGPSQTMDIFCSVFPRFKTLWDFCMNTPEYGYFEACNPHTLPVTNLKLCGFTNLKKVDSRGIKI